MKQFSVILIGAGSRGRTYTHFMSQMPDKYKIIGVAEPVEVKRKAFAQKHEIPEENCFVDWREILNRPKMADIAVIATMDNEHYAPAMKAIELGYHLLLEKPVAPTVEQCTDIANAAKDKGVSVIVCHVLRYTPFFKTVKNIVDSGRLGKIMSIDHVEGIGDVHFSHSYVRGHWHSEAETTPMLLAKSCHDLDIIQWLVGKNCKKVQSFGSLTYFTEENAPEGAPVRCIDGGCPIAKECPYNSYKVYIENMDRAWWKSAFRSIVATHPDFTDDELMEALKRTDYGLCVFHANNDVNDHQVVNMEFEGGVTASLTVNAFNRGGRYIRIYGTKGELYAFMEDESIYVKETYNERNREHVPVMKTIEGIEGGHGGGDAGIVYDLYDYLNGTYQGVSVADIHISVANHLIGFAAEESRHNDTVVSMDTFCEKHDFTV
ncbi:MAG: Gfo/Idh/MocA family oxidoreductase [Clostridia bacterium]|nr:Gfo/Idh/MocA family oxidoreductase [Clostridia bacterium]